MNKKLGNYCLLFGTLCLAIFFTSSSFLVDPSWFLVGGIGLFALGILIKRSKHQKRVRKGKIRRMRWRERENDDETS